MSHLGERLSAFVDGELGHEQRDRVLAHLAKCEPCRLETAALRLLKRRMRALGEATAGDDALTDRLMAMAPAGPPGDAPPVNGRRGAAESWPRWPVRALALSALAMLALGLPAVAFVAGGSQAEPGPSVTPAVDVYLTQHAITTGAVPAVPDAPVSDDAEGAGGSEPAGGSSQLASSYPEEALAQPGAAARSLEHAVVGRSHGRVLSGPRNVARPPQRRDATAPGSKRDSNRQPGRRQLASRGG
jgi:hypothetical protein